MTTDNTQLLPTVEQVINEDGAFAVVIRNWWPNAQELHQHMITDLPWVTRTTEYNGKVTTIKRQSCFMADEHIKHYPFGTLHAHNWHNSNNYVFNEARHIRDCIKNDTWIKQMLGIELHFDSCLAQNYAKPTDKIAYHSDQEALGPLNAVVTLSLGDDILFRFRSKQKGSNGRYPRKDVILGNGDLTVMAGRCQELWTHGIEEDKTGTRLPRESLTYRCVTSNT